MSAAANAAGCLYARGQLPVSELNARRLRSAIGGVASKLLHRLEPRLQLLR